MDMSSGQQVAASSTSGSINGRKSVQLANRHQQGRGFSSNKQQFSSFILFLSVVIIVNLSPFQSDLELSQQPNDAARVDGSNMEPIAEIMPNKQRHPTVATSGEQHGSGYLHQLSSANYLRNLQACFKFIELMFTNPIRLSGRQTHSIQAEAKVLGKMAKMWYIKKKIKKLSKKLKKHTIAVPVFTAIPIYEHSY